MRAHARRSGCRSPTSRTARRSASSPTATTRRSSSGRQPDVARAGAIVDERGQLLGTHGGVHRFTVGQRKGLGVASTSRSTCCDRRRPRSVTVGPRAALEHDTLTASGVNWIRRAPASPVRVAAQIRHRHKPAPGGVRALPDGRAEMMFDEPQTAITPGQAVVFYDGDVGRRRRLDRLEHPNQLQLPTPKVQTSESHVGDRNLEVGCWRSGVPMPATAS